MLHGDTRIHSDTIHGHNATVILTEDKEEAGFGAVKEWISKMVLKDI